VPPSSTSTDDRTRWAFEPGHEFVPGLAAWALLGGGPRCETWLAWDLDRWSPVAVKLPHPHELGRAKAEAALARELAALEGLAHPGLQRLLDARLDASPPHLVFEYVEGPTLAAALEDEEFELVDVLLIGTQIATALRYLHGRGLVHLDVKPGNTVLREGRAVLIDLGIARRIGQPHPPGRARGSRSYMAPEQAARAPAHPSMDLYALGGLLRELATGARPDEPVASLPPALAELTEALLRPDPGDRPGTAGEVLMALAAALPDGLAEEDRPWPAFVGGLEGRRPPADEQGRPARGPSGAAAATGGPRG
jgi:serine/threonine protein kinase